MGDVDAALAAFAPFAVELAKDIATAQNYYQREEYKKDSFAKGKELAQEAPRRVPEARRDARQAHDRLRGVATKITPPIPPRWKRAKSSP